MYSAGSLPDGEWADESEETLNTTHGGVGKGRLMHIDFMGGGKANKIGPMVGNLQSLWTSS